MNIGHCVLFHQIVNVKNKRDFSGFTELGVQKSEQWHLFEDGAY